ncbi:MAG: AAA family ATPase, partial [Nitrosotalea sp.]
EIEIGIPDQQGRREILNIHTRGMPIEEKVNLDQIAKVTHGFVGADLEILAKEAAMRSLRRILPDLDLEAEKIPVEILQKIIITDNDFKDALKEVRPSALREVLVQVPNVTWADVGGLKSLKEELYESVEWPLKHREAFEHADVAAPKGILLYGPPGTGKTLIAKAVAHTSESNFISIKGPELLSKWVGESEKGVREIFRKARQAAPCIIFLDELDSLAPSRSSGSSDSGVTERVVSQLLTEIDGLEELHDVLIIGATNRVDLIDSALLRPGRFDRIIEVPLPDTEGRENIFKIHTRKKPIAEGTDFAKLVQLTDGFSGAEIEGVCNRAAMSSIRRYVDTKEKSVKSIKVTQEDFENAIEKIRPNRVKPKQIVASQII